MSERGTFVTSYLYDYPHQAAALRKVLPHACREGAFREMRFEAVDSEEKARAFMGLMHGGYPGEEAEQMRYLIEDELLKELPEKHGEFSISVLPEEESAATVFTIRDRRVKRYRVGKATEETS